MFKKISLALLSTVLIGDSQFVFSTTTDETIDAYDGFSWPVNFKYDNDSGFMFEQDTSDYYKTCGKDVDVKLHPGIDINKKGGDIGEPVFAIANGTVVDVNSNYSRIVIKHVFYDPYYGSDRKKHIVYSVYGHSEISPSGCENLKTGSGDFEKVELNSSVRKGQQIACISDWKADKGAYHLHFEIRKEKAQVDPSTGKLDLTTGHPDPETGSYFCKVANIGDDKEKLEYMYENPDIFLQKYSSSDWRCARLKHTTEELCWIFSDDCESGANHQLINNDIWFLEPTRVGPWYCSSIDDIYEKPLPQTIVSSLSPISNGDYGGGGTSTPPDPSEQPASGKRPDFITSKVTMGNKDGKHEKYTWKINETAYVHDYIDNIGTADWWGSKDSIKVSFYLSKGSKEDSHSEWVRIGDRQNIKKENLKVKKDPKHEKIEFKLQNYANNGTVMPGRTYNFVVCADHPKDHNNNGGDVEEKHESNNCSTEAVFYVDYGPPRNVDLLASNLALTGGRSSLQAGEKYGLQVEVSNIGTQQPWNGFSTNYEIKGPGTGGAWQKIGEDTSRASSLYPNATHFESMTDAQEVSAPMTGGDYVFRACADYSQAVPETDESNNCTDELPVYIAPPPMPDLITEGLQLTHGRTSLIAGELYGLTVAIRNIGNATPSSNIRSSYAIKGPGTGDAWQQVADDGSDADQLYPGAAQWEEITDEHGAHILNVAGTYTARACADYQGNVPESDENNNCSEMTFEVQPIPAGSPSIVITNPTHDDDWRSDETDHDVRWDRFDFPTPGNVRVEYSLDGGATWQLIDDNTTNDGKKHWEDMCDYHTIDTHNAFIRVTSLEYPYIYDVSDEFSIDHAAECE